MSSDGSQPSVLIDREQLQRRVIELAAEIESCVPQDAELVLVGVLTGAFVFLADLTRAISRTHRDAFVRVSSYDENDQPIPLTVHETKTPELRGKHVVLVDDIVDRGRTLVFLKEWATAQGARSVRCCALLNKPSGRETEITPDWIGFDVPDVWVVGYGMDSGGLYRSLPYVGVLDQTGR